MKAVILDYGGVLSYFPATEQIDQIAKLLSVKAVLPFKAQYR